MKIDDNRDDITFDQPGIFTPFITSAFFLHQSYQKHPFYIVFVLYLFAHLYWKLSKDLCHCHYRKQIPPLPNFATWVLGTNDKYQTDSIIAFTTLTPRFFFILTVLLLIFGQPWKILQSLINLVLQKFVRACKSIIAWICSVP